MPSDQDAIRRWLTDIHYHIRMAKGFVTDIGYENYQG
jgi:hypothetical protein